MRTHKRFVDDQYTRQIEITAQQLIYRFDGTATGETKDIDVDGVEVHLTEYAETEYLYWQLPITDTAGLKARFIQEYLDFKECGINEQLAAMANGGADLEAYQALRAEAKTKAGEFITAYETFEASQAERNAPESTKAADNKQQ